MVLFDQTVFE